MVGGLVGAIVMNFAPLDDLLPVNRTLFSTVCALIVIWMLASVTTSWGDES